MRPVFHLDATIPIQRIEVAAYTIPTDAPESDGTIEWNSTTIIVVHLWAADREGLGYSYASHAAAALIQHTLAPELLHRNALDIPKLWHRMVASVRNMGRPGIASTAISAVDVALWDLKAQLLSLPLLTLFGAARESIPVYGSGGFTSYSDQQLESQFLDWKEKGIRMFKMKVGRDPHADLHRVQQARHVVGDNADLMVDANGAYSRKLALHQAEFFADQNVCWFEEPVSSDDLEGLRLIRDRAPAGMEIAAGEYGYDAYYFRRMIECGAVDVLQADATRCGGITGFLQAAALCTAWGLPSSSHTAPAIHMHLCCACQPVRHLEYFHDHERIERMLFDGTVEVTNGNLRPDLARPGLGLHLKLADAQRFAA